MMDQLVQCLYLLWNVTTGLHIIDKFQPIHAMQAWYVVEPKTDSTKD